MGGFSGPFMQNISQVFSLDARPDSDTLSIAPSSEGPSIQALRPTEHWYKQRHLHRKVPAFSPQRSMNPLPKAQTVLRRPCRSLDICLQHQWWLTD